MTAVRAMKMPYKNVHCSYMGFRKTRMDTYITTQTRKYNIVVYELYFSIVNGISDYFVSFLDRDSH